METPRVRSFSGSSSVNMNGDMKYTAWKYDDASRSYSIESASSTGVTIDRNLMLEGFVESLRKGIYVTKYGSHGSPRKRKLFIDDTATAIFWTNEDGTPSRNNGKKFRISEIKEIRWGVDPDPLEKEKGLAGTQILRDTCRWEDAPLAFSIVWPERTLDLRCFTALECKYMIHCFREMAKSSSWF